MQNTDDEIRDLWREYRTAKCVPNMTELMIRHYGSDFLPEMNQEAGHEGPAPGSMFWMLTIDAPVWFQRAMTGDQIVVALQEAGGKKIPKHHQKA